MTEVAMMVVKNKDETVGPCGSDEILGDTIPILLIVPREVLYS